VTPGSAPWLAGALTLLTLVAAMTGALEPGSRTEFGGAVLLVAAASGALFARGRSRQGFGDWRFLAPAALAITFLAAETGAGLVLVAVLLISALVSYQWMVRGRDLAAVSEASSATALLTTCAGLAALGWFGKPLAAPVVIPLAAIWLLVWMHPRTRQIRDPFPFHVACPAEKLSAYLVDQRNLVAWYPGYKTSELEEGHDLGEGAVFRQVIEFRGHPQSARVVVDEYAAGKRLSTHVIDVPGRGASRYTFTESGGGTDAVYEFLGDQSYATALTGTMLLIGGTLRKLRAQRQGAFDSLRAILEAG
jgi:hypothetical protein